MKKIIYPLVFFVVCTLLVVSCSTASTVTPESQTVKSVQTVSENKVEESKAQAITETQKELKAEIAEVPQDEVGADSADSIVRNYELMGHYFKVTIENGVAFVEYPSIVTKKDIDNAVAAAVSVYGDYLKDITYSVEDGVMTINFPTAYGIEELLLAEKIISDELPAYVESLLEETPVVVEPANETVKEEVKTETVAKAEPAKAETPAKVAEVPVVQEEPKNESTKTVIIIVAAVLVLFVLALSVFIKKKNKK